MNYDWRRHVQPESKIKKFVSFASLFSENSFASIYYCLFASQKLLQSNKYILFAIESLILLQFKNVSDLCFF